MYDTLVLLDKALCLCEIGSLLNHYDSLRRATCTNIHQLLCLSTFSLPFLTLLFFVACTFKALLEIFYLVGSAANCQKLPPCRFVAVNFQVVGCYNVLIQGKCYFSRCCTLGASLPTISATNTQTGQQFEFYCWDKLMFGLCMKINEKLWHVAVR